MAGAGAPAAGAPGRPSLQLPLSAAWPPAPAQCAPTPCWQLSCAASPPVVGTQTAEGEARQRVRRRPQGRVTRDAVATRAHTAMRESQVLSSTGAAAFCCCVPCGTASGTNRGCVAGGRLPGAALCVRPRPRTGLRGCDVHSWRAGLSALAWGASATQRPARRGLATVCSASSGGVHPLTSIFCTAAWDVGTTRVAKGANLCVARHAGCRLGRSTPSARGGEGWCYLYSR